MAERQAWWLERRVVLAVGVFLVLGASIGWVLHEPAECVDEWPHTVPSAVHKDGAGNNRTCGWLLKDIVDRAFLALDQPGADKPSIQDAIKSAHACAAADNLLPPHDLHRDKVDAAYTHALAGQWHQCSQELKGVNHPH